MEKASSFEVNLPVGFRFCPTDQELLVHYLARKVLAIPLPAPAVTDFDVFRTEPSALPGDSREKRHFFSRISRNDCKRVADGSGYWKPLGKGKQIVAASGSNHIPIGVRKSWGFHEIRGSNAAKKHWVMQEFRLLDPIRPGKNRTVSEKQEHIAIDGEEEREWAVYRVFQKNRKPKRRRSCSELLRPCVIDFRGEEGDSRSDPPPPPTSPSSSSDHDSNINVYH